MISVYKDIRTALEKNRGGPIKTFLDVDGKPLKGVELQAKSVKF